jgi:two-component system, NarL family, invasion response regulator UvrY
VRIAVKQQPDGTPSGDPAWTVLIVDDQAPFRSAARSLVGLIGGWRVIGEVGSGEDAIETASATRPDLVLMDINLPGISGIEATRRIVAADPGIAVVLLSTYAAEDLPEDARSCGAVGYIGKADLTPRRLRTLLAER